MLMSLALSALLIAFEHSYGLLKELRLAAFNLEQAFDTKPLPYREEQVTLKHFDVAFDHVSFSYNLQTEVLHDIGFHAKEGSTTALIGPSGSGKSTVANLMGVAIPFVVDTPISAHSSIYKSFLDIVGCILNLFLSAPFFGEGKFK